MTALSFGVRDRLKLAVPVLGLLLLSQQAAAQRRGPEKGSMQVVQGQVVADLERPPVVALLPFDGKEAATPPQNPLAPRATSDLVEKLISERTPKLYKVLPQAEWVRMARRRFQGKTGQIEAIAKALQADVVVGGWLEATPSQEANRPYRLTIALYNSWAEPLGQVPLDLERRDADVATLAAHPQSATVFQMIDRALGLHPMQKRPGGTARAPGGVSQADDTESAPLTGPEPVLGQDSGPARDVPLVPPNPEAQEIYYQRPPWRPVFDLQAGYLFSSRHLSDNGSGREFNRSGASGVILHGELYPLAELHRVPLAAAGLGVRVTVLLPFWPDIKQVDETGAQTGLLSATEYRAEVGFLRWHWNFAQALLRPDIQLEALYGYHHFDVDRKLNVNIVNIPPVDYSYLGASIGTRVYLLRRWHAQLGVALAGILDTGPMGQPGAPMDNPTLAAPPRTYHVYGPGNGWLWRLDFATGVRVWRGLSVNFGFYYEQKLLSFDGIGDILLRQQPARNPGGEPGAPPVKVTSATDEYGGVYFTLGYVY